HRQRRQRQSRSNFECEVVMTNNEAGARADWLRRYREAISALRSARDRENCDPRHTDRLIGHYEQEANAASVDDPSARAAALEETMGSRRFDWIKTKLPLVTAHIIFTNTGRTYEGAAALMVDLRPAIKKHFDMVQVRKDFNRHRPDRKDPMLAEAFECMGGEEATDHTMAIRLTLWAKLPSSSTPGR